MKYFLYLTCLFQFSSQLLAADNLDSQTNLRTLFTTSQVRNQLDQLRDQGKFDNIKNESPSIILRDPAVVKMQGVVIRKNTKPVVFVNDANTLKSPRVSDEVYVNTAKVKKQEYQIPARVYGKKIKLKPGQQWSETRRQVQENFQIKPPKPKTDENDEVMNNADNLTNTPP